MHYGLEAVEIGRPGHRGAPNLAMKAENIRYFQLRGACSTTLALADLGHFTRAHAPPYTQHTRIGTTSPCTIQSLTVA